MKIWMAIAVMMFAAVGHAGKAEARYLDGNALLEQCEGESAVNKTTCYGYLMGIEDTVDLYYNLGRLNKGWCIPDGVSAGQLRKVAIKGLNDKPEWLHLPAASSLRLIFKDAFPCD